MKKRSEDGQLTLELPTRAAKKIQANVVTFTDLATRVIREEALQRVRSARIFEIPQPKQAPKK